VPKSIVIASENIDAIQAMYVDGLLACHEDTIYAWQIADAAAGDAITLKQIQVDLPADFDWPETLEALLETTRRRNVLAWAVSRWNEEVKNRPAENIHRHTLDCCWRQVIRYCGGEHVLKKLDSEEPIE
jgi:hypothetical protein